jgi:hypothetical protein
MRIEGTDCCHVKQLLIELRKNSMADGMPAPFNR